MSIILATWYNSLYDELTNFVKWPQKEQKI